MNSVFRRSENVVFRKIEGEYILVPLTSSSEDVESIFNLNEAGTAIWEKIDGKRTVHDIVDVLLVEYDAAPQTIKSDVTSFINELIEAGLIEVS